MKPNYCQRDMPPPPWAHNRRLVLISIIIVVFVISFLFLLGLGMVVYYLSTIPRMEMRHPSSGGMMFLCLVPLIFITLASFMGGLGFSRFGRPLADVISAANAVARGDLSVRLSEKVPHALRGLAYSFNHMADELERAEKQRSNMTADIAHELRNPLHIIQGNLEGMLDGVYEPNEENIASMLEETHLLARLVSDLQTLSLAEAGQLPLHTTQFLVADLLNDVAASFSSQTSEHDIDLQVNCPHNLQQTEIIADYDRLDQVLSNLVANALRYTPNGGNIILSVEVESTIMRITVKDNGSGIPAKDLPYIFDRFWKADRARSRAAGGSGLGLAIAQQLIRAHGGTINATSQMDSGTTFTIELNR